MNEESSRFVSSVFPRHERALKTQALRSARSNREIRQTIRRGMISRTFVEPRVAITRLVFAPEVELSLQHINS